MIASGLVTGADLDALVALCDEPRFRVLSQIIMASWARRPGVTSLVRRSSPRRARPLDPP
jgi:hypothetical protein